jgi:hypothetical protein
LDGGSPHQGDCLNETRVERYLRERGNRQTIQAGDRAALKRWLSVLRATGTIAPVVQSQTTPHDQIFAEFGDYLQRERGLSRSPSSATCRSSASSCVKCAPPAPVTSARSVRKP